MARIKRTFEIETSPEVMERLERFFALLHHNSNFGHSGTFAMPLDGDGDDKVTIDPAPRFKCDVDLTGGIGGDVEIAYNNCFSVKDFKEVKSDYIVKSSATLYVDGEPKKTYPKS